MPRKQGAKKMAPPEEGADGFPGLPPSQETRASVCPPPRSLSPILSPHESESLKGINELMTLKLLASWCKLMNKSKEIG